MPARPKRTIRQVDLGAASAEHQHTESDITDLDHYDSSDFAADHANADHTHDHDGDYADIAHTHELDELNATGITDGHVLTAQGDGTAAWEAPTGGGGVTDHGDLTGLEDDDHPQYLTEARHDADDHSSLTITESQISDLDHWDQADTEGVIDAYVNKAFVDALNVDADTLDGEHASAFADAVHTHTESDITDLDHTDDDAIHGNVGGEIAALAEKVSPVSSDLLLIEDSADSNAKKKVQVGNLPGGGGGGGVSLLAREIYTSDATWTKADYPGISYVVVQVVGGGGGGGEALATSNVEVAAGDGGGAGGYADAIVQAASLGATETVTVGAGGAGGAGGNSAVAGGTSSFGSHASATGGAPGGLTRTGTQTVVRRDDVLGGVGTAGDLLLPGGNGGGAFVSDNTVTDRANGGHGGSSQFGEGGRSFNSGNSGAAGEAGRGFGSGGSGACNSVSQPARAGGAGADGIVIVELFF